MEIRYSKPVSEAMGLGRTADHSPFSAFMARAYHGPSASVRNWSSALRAAGDPLAAMRAKRSATTHGNGLCCTSVGAASAAAADEIRAKATITRTRREVIGIILGL